MEILLLFIGFGAIVLLVRFLLQKLKIILPKKYFKVLLIAHLFFAFLFIVAVIISNYNIYFRGYRSHSFIFITACFTGIFVYWFAPKAKWAYVLGVISFFEIIVVLILLKNLSHDFVFYNTNNFRIEANVLENRPLPIFFVKKGLLERKISLYENCFFDFTEDKIDSINVEQLSIDTVKIVFYHQHTFKKQESISFCKIKIE